MDREGLGYGVLFLAVGFLLAALVLGNFVAPIAGWICIGGALVASGVAAWLLIDEWKK